MVESTTSGICQVQKQPSRRNVGYHQVISCKCVKKAKLSRTFCSARNLVIHATLGGAASGLNSDVPLPPRQEVRNSDKDVTSGTPQVLYDIVLSPLVCYSNLVYRIDVLDQLQVCTPEDFFLPLSPAIEPGHRSASSEGQTLGTYAISSPSLSMRLIPALYSPSSRASTAASLPNAGVTAFKIAAVA